MTNPLGDYERNKAMGLLKDENDPFSMKHHNHEHEGSTQRAPEDGEGNSLLDWMEMVRKHIEASDKKETARYEFLDKIITELDAVDTVWWRHYTQAAEIINCEDAIHTANLHKEVNISARNGKKRLKREIVSYVILPAVHACIRAGFVKPTE